MSAYFFIREINLIDETQKFIHICYALETIQSHERFKFSILSFITLMFFNDSSALNFLIILVFFEILSMRIK